MGLVLGERRTGFAVSDLLPGPTLPVVVGAVDLGQLGAGDTIPQLLEEPAGADRPELRGVAGEDELAVGLGGQLGEPGQALGVGHPGLVHDDDGPGAQLDAAFLDAVAETVGGEGAVELRVVMQPLRGGAGDGGADHLIALQLPGPGGGGDHDALAGAGAADELRDAAGAGDRLQRLALLLA